MMTIKPTVVIMDNFKGQITEAIYMLKGTEVKHDS